MNISHISKDIIESVDILLSGGFGFSLKKSAAILFDKWLLQWEKDNDF